MTTSVMSLMNFGRRLIIYEMLRNLDFLYYLFYLDLFSSIIISSSLISIVSLSVHGC